MSIFFQSNAIAATILQPSSIDQKIKAITQGEVGNFHELYLKYSNLVRRVLFKLHPRSQLDDLVQETFIKIWKGIARFESKSSLKVWIYQIAHHVAIDALRQRKSSPEQTAEIPEGLVGSSESFLTHQNLVHKLLGRFSFEHRAVIVLFFMEELSLQEIAETLKIPLGTVKSRLHYAKHKIQDMLRQEKIEL